MADFETPEVGEYVPVPSVTDGTMAHSKPFVAAAQHQA